METEKLQEAIRKLHALQDEMQKNIPEVVDILVQMIIDRQGTEPKCYPETRYCGPTVACGKCHHEFAVKNPKYCPYCGEPVKREKPKAK